MIRAGLLRQQAEARKTMHSLQKLFPGAFHADGKPIVAELRLPSPTRLIRPTDGKISHHHQKQGGPSHE